MTHTTPESNAPVAAPQAKALKFFFLALAVLMLVGWVKGCYLPLKEKEAEEAKTTQAKAAQQAAEYTATHPQRPIVTIGKQRKLYRFDESGCATIVIHDGEASWYPKGGRVTIFPPAPAQPWEDAPGILTKEEGVIHPPGTYKVCQKDSDAWGIEVWN